MAKEMTDEEFREKLTPEEYAVLREGETEAPFTGEYVDMFKEGIIDPLKVVKATLTNAASIASLILTTEAVVAELPSEKEEKSPRMPEDY